jgi:hypothetical protein
LWPSFWLWSQLEENARTLNLRFLETSLGYGQSLK